MSSNVTAIFGGATGLPEPNETCIAALEEWLDMARSGEVIGVSVSALCHDGLARFGIAGKVGGFSMLGAIEMCRQEIVDVNRDG